MRKVLTSLLLLLFSAGVCKAADTLYIKETVVPLLLERQDNVVYYLRYDSSADKVFQKLTLHLDESVPLRTIKSVKLYYGGVEAPQRRGKGAFAPTSYISAHAVGRTLAALPSLSVLQSKVDYPQSYRVELSSKQNLFADNTHYFWISVELNSKVADLHTKLSMAIEQATIGGEAATIDIVSAPNIIHRTGVGVRHAGDSGAAAYRIPGLVTTKSGTLLGVYDVRYDSSIDLQGHIDVGVSRSTDGGRTWEKMRLPMAFGEMEGLPKGQNGVGDPCVLVDERTGTIWIVAVWAHGMGYERTWWSSRPGMDKHTTAQMMMVRSDDDGRTWSKPINVTEQVKKPEWYFFFQGPGRGITMEDGTLVFPIQYKDADQVPSAGIMYSKDGGATWMLHNTARLKTTEAQVVEVSPGVLMLNMRDDRGGSRAVSTTTDLGKTWQEHPSSRSALIEPVCMASLIGVKAKDNVLGRDILIFSNPNSTNSRTHITIKVSLDGGLTWLPEHQLLLDEEPGWGYSCLTMLDKQTVGILYESSVAHMTFQSIPLRDIVK